MRAQIARHTVEIPGCAGDAPQKAIFYRPVSAAPGSNASAAPLLVLLHTWSGGFEQGGAFVPVCAARGWTLIAPDFRGRNDRPEACASELAVRDVLDAVAYARAHARIDPARLYVVGSSGGGHMALVMAARAPDLWAGVSAWVPICDLVVWHTESRARNNRYAEMIERCCGGPPGPDTAIEYRNRSPLFHLGAAKDLPLDINAGIHDGHTGSVPISQSVRAFNVLAVANGYPERQVDEASLGVMLRERRVPPPLDAERVPDPERAKPVLFRRAAGAVRLTIFEGGHDIEQSAALDWLSRQRQGRPADHRVGRGTGGGGPSGAREVPR